MAYDHPDITSLLTLEPHGPDTFVGTGPEYPWGKRVYGGQVVAQALRAAALTVDGPYRAHSLHAYFIRPGDADEPIRFEVDRLRNLKAVRLELPAGLTLITGRNGQGKTSLLEAAYLLATGRSFRARKLEDLVAWSGGPLRVRGSVARRTSRGARAPRRAPGPARAFACCA